MSEFLKISGKKFALDSKASPGWSFSPRPGGWIVAESPDGKRCRFAAWSARGKISFSIGGELFYGEWIEERKGHGVSASGGDSDLIAQFPGKVRKILVTAGARVEEALPLILIEAMKMEFTVKAPFAGVIKRVLVTEGQQLAPGDRFFELEEAVNSNGG